MRRALANGGRCVGCWSGRLEGVGGRAALLAGAIESYAGAGFGLGCDGGVADDLCKDEGGSVGREISVLNLGDGRWV
jgi:hypothetical protein